MLKTATPYLSGVCLAVTFLLCSKGGESGNWSPQKCTQNWRIKQTKSKLNQWTVSSDMSADFLLHSSCYFLLYYLNRNIGIQFVFPSQILQILPVYSPECKLALSQDTHDTFAPPLALCTYVTFYHSKYPQFVLLQCRSNRVMCSVV